MILLPCYLKYVITYPSVFFLSKIKIECWHLIYLQLIVNTRRMNLDIKHSVISPLCPILFVYVLFLSSSLVSYRCLLCSPLSFLPSILNSLVCRILSVTLPLSLPFSLSFFPFLPFSSK
jgi:hypothetical protein